MTLSVVLVGDNAEVIQGTYHNTPVFWTMLCQAGIVNETRLKDGHRLYIYEDARLIWEMTYRKQDDHNPGPA